jgi:hypothetical protein
VHVHNLVARWTWSVEVESDEAPDPSEPFSPHVVKLEYRNQKHNDGPKQRDRHVSFSFYPVGGVIEASEDAASARQTTLQKIESVFEDGFSTRDIFNALKEDFGESPSVHDINTVLTRGGGGFTKSAKRPYRFSRKVVP